MKMNRLEAAYILLVQPQLINFRNYAEHIELDFEERAHKVEKELEDFYNHAGIIEGWEREFEHEADDFIELHGNYRSEFPAILRSSLLVSVYAFFEQKLVEECKPTKNGLTISDIKGGSIIQRAKKYIEKVMEKEFPTNNEHWMYIREVNAIRNCIVHNGSFVELNDSKLRNIINNMENIKINDNNKIVIEQGFVEKMIDHVDAFLFELLVESKLKRYMERVTKDS